MMTFRFANPEDAAPFARWAAENPDIPQRDIEASMKENNPTATFLVIEDEGKVILAVPLFAVVRIACLLFNPEADERQKIAAMGKMREAIMAFAASFGINSVDTLSKSGYAVARWAVKHGFEQENRELFELKGFLNV